MKKAILMGAIITIVCVSASFAFAADGEQWKNDVALGYSQKTGNTQNQQLNASYEALRATESDEVNLKVSTLYSAQNKKMDGQKHTGSARYAPNLGDTDWFSFAKLEVEHDKFAGIDSRIIPSVGAGYWFTKTEVEKLSAELGIGHEFIEYIDNTNDDNTTLISRGYFEKAVLEKATISQELIFYPNLKDGKKYRIYAESRFTNPISDEMSLRLSFIDEFNTDPLGNSKKNDTQLLVLLVYSF